MFNQLDAGAGGIDVLLASGNVGIVFNMSRIASGKLSGRRGSSVVELTQSSQPTKLEPAASLLVVAAIVGFRLAAAAAETTHVEILQNVVHQASSGDAGREEVRANKLGESEPIWAEPVRHRKADHPAFNVFVEVVDQSPR